MHDKPERCPVARSLPAYFGVAEAALLVFVLAVGIACWPAGTGVAWDLVRRHDLSGTTAVLDQIGRTRDADALSLACREQLMQGQVERALDLSAQSVRAAGDSIAHRVAHARLLEVFLKPREAMDVLAEAAAIHRRWRAQGAPDPARMLPEGAVLDPGRAPTADALRERFESWFLPARKKLAFFYRWYQDLPHALLTQREIVRDSPTDARAWAILARLESYARDRAASERALARAAELGFTEEDLRYLLARRYRTAGQVERMCAELRRSHQAAEAVREDVLRACIESGNGAGAVKLYMERFPGEAAEGDVYVEAITLLVEADRVPAAYRLAVDARARYPQDRRVLALLGVCQVQLGKFGDAAATYQELHRLDPGNETYIEEAVWALDAAGREQESIALMEVLSRRGPPSRARRRELGVRYAEMNLNAQALPFLEEAHAANPDDREVTLLLAEVLGELGQAERSVDLYRKFLAPAGSAPVATGSRGLAPAARASRRVLALYKRLEGDRTEQNLVHQRLELVLNHLGLAVTYRAVEDPLPSAAVMETYRGVVTWFHTEEMQDAERYVTWLAAQRAAGRGLVILDRLGCTTDRATHRPISDGAMATLAHATGLDPGVHASEDPLEVRVVQVDPSLCEFERKLAYEAASFEEFKSIDPAATVHLKLKLERPVPATSDAVVTAPGMGFCLAGYAVHVDEDGDREAWRLDPFRFLERVLELEGQPRLDFTTRNGARLVYAQVDGDGSDHLCPTDPPRTAAHELLGVIERYDLDFTVSFIAGLLDPARGCSPEAEAEARRLFAHPKVEPAHHTYSHPFDWARPEPGLPVPGYERMDLERELVGARDLLQRLCPPEKKLRVCLWSGDSNPTAAALEVLERAGMENLNGGLAARDANHPSILDLEPTQHEIGGRHHHLGAAVNDYVASDEVRWPLATYANVLATYRETEAPRLIPVDVYFHFYLLADAGGRRALTTVLDWVEEADLGPVPVTGWLSVLRGFRAGAVVPRGERAWSIHDFGDCRTVRFDREAGSVDFARSRGVLGQHRTGGALYVHLDAVGEALVALAPAPAAAPHLVRATAPVERFAGTPGGVSFVTRGQGRRSFVLAGLTPGASCTIHCAGGPTVTAQSTGHGELSFRLLLRGESTVRVETRRSTP